MMKMCIKCIHQIHLARVCLSTVMSCAICMGSRVFVYLEAPFTY